MLGLLRPFTGSFKLAVALWPLASFVLTLPVLAVVYHRRGRITLASLAWSYLAVLYALGLVCLTLYPLPEGTSGPGITYGMRPQLDLGAFVGDIERHGKPALFQVLANVAFFVPLGYLLGYGLRWKLPAVAAGGFLVSLLIESTQLTGDWGLYPYAYRTFDVDDLLANTCGAALGLAFAALVAKLTGRKAYVAPAVTHRPSFVRRSVAAVIDLGLAAVAAAVVTAGVLLALLRLDGTAAAEPLKHLVRRAGVDLTRADLVSVVSLVAFMVLFTLFTVVVELWVPLRREGCTPGGGFVRMSCETRPRTGWRRALFYGARLFVFLCLFSLPWVAPSNWLCVPVTCVALYPFLKGMPYDRLPADPEPPTPPASPGPAAGPAEPDRLGRANPYL